MYHGQNARRALLVSSEPASSRDAAELLMRAMPGIVVERAADAARGALTGEHNEVIIDARQDGAAALVSVQAVRESAPDVPLVVLIEAGSPLTAELLGRGADECSVAEPAALGRALAHAHARRTAAAALARSMQAENERARQARMSRHNEALRALTRQLSSDDLREQLNAISEAAAHTLEVGRSSVWLLDAEQRQLRAVDSFDRRTGEHGDGMVLLARDHPAYFRALEDQRVVLAEDAREHFCTRTLRASYLEPHDVHSFLAAPIRVGNRWLGVLCHEQVGGPRRFTDEDASVAGSLSDFVALAIESHEHRRAEEALRTSNERLDEARRIEAVGRLAGGVAHDFNNVITVVSSYAFLMAKKLDKDDPLQVPVAEIGKAAERAADITRKLLALSRREPAPPRVFDMNHVVRGMESFLHRLIGEHITLKLELFGEPLLLRADPGQIEQIILNLVVNARDAARPEGSTITIRTFYDAGTKKKAERPCGLEVADTGVGMTPEVQARIFEPFFTTKEVGKGSGLGLFTVYGAVTQMNGTVDVKSTPNRGTRFILRFAQATPEAATGHVAPDRRELLGSETLLLVEDEAQVRDVTALILRELGYKVLEAANIDQALTHARANRSIDMLVSDIVMPKASGTVVAARIKELIPSLRVLFISGYNKEMLSAYDASLGPTLPKPFTAEQIGRKVRELLDEKDGTARAQQS
jgi:two-component system cell cycle sensor histidine kinase/response regulator CckA